MNIFCGTGRLTKDPVINHTENNCIASFSIAIPRRFKTNGQYESDFFNVKAFRQTAEFVEKYIKKGVKIEVTGSLQQDKWTDKDGNNRTTTVIIADSISFAESKGSQQTSAPAQATPQPTQAQAQTPTFMQMPDSIDEQLPFN